ncbi:MAG TPA: PilZ domain-containing protein [Acidimicrobiales bacterium]|nr:PilZ domain-containing protein [Acidimicrobiales bacterium]
MADTRDSKEQRASKTERRIGSRQPLGHGITFQPSIVRRNRRKSERARSATIVDFSLSGLLISSVADDHIEVGTQAVIDADGLHAVVQVERIEKTDDPKTRLYGVQFLSIDPQFRHLIAEAVASPGTDWSDWR